MTVVKQFSHSGWQIRMNIPAVEWVQRSRFFCGRWRGWLPPRQPGQSACDSLEFLKATWHSTDSPECCGRFDRTFLGRPLVVSSLRSEQLSRYRGCSRSRIAIGCCPELICQPCASRVWVLSKVLGLPVLKPNRGLQSSRGVETLRPANA